MARSACAVVVVLAGAAAPAASQEVSELPRGTLIDEVIVQPARGAAVRGEARVVEVFDPAAGHGSATLVIEVSPGPLRDLLAELHRSGTAVGASIRRYRFQHAWPKGAAPMPYTLRNVMVTDFTEQRGTARATLRVGAALPAIEPRTDTRPPGRSEPVGSRPPAAPPFVR
jgi:hypothetical protein